MNEATIWFICVVGWSMLVAAIAVDIEQNFQYNRAVAAGAGEYYLDAHNTKQFRYTAHPAQTQKAEHE